MKNQQYFLKLYKNIRFYKCSKTCCRVNKLNLELRLRTHFFVHIYFKYTTILNSTCSSEYKCWMVFSDSISFVTEFAWFNICFQEFFFFTFNLAQHESHFRFFLQPVAFDKWYLKTLKSFQQGFFKVTNKYWK